MRSKWTVLGTCVLQTTFLMLTTLNEAILLPTRMINQAEAHEVVQKFMCNEPQLRAYQMNYLLSGLLNTADIPYPTYIVLKRCDMHSGCCTSYQKSCHPMETYNEQMEVNVQDAISREWRKQKIQVEQHLKCACKPMDHIEQQACLECPKDSPCRTCRECEKPRVSLFNEIVNSSDKPLNR